MAITRIGIAIGANMTKPMTPAIIASANSASHTSGGTITSSATSSAQMTAAVSVGRRRRRWGARSSAGQVGGQPVELGDADGAIGRVAAHRQLVVLEPAGGVVRLEELDRSLAVEVGGPHVAGVHERHVMTNGTAPVEWARQAGRVAGMRTGGQLLADGLVAHGSELAFCVPGESYLALLDGLYEHRDRFRIVNCRHEGAAANAADAYGKLTGRPGICMVTRGPGATHAATGIHTARQDSTPLILLVGQIARAERGRESFQELDYEAVFGPMAKWAFELDDPARIPEVLARAYTVATSGRPGPVVLALPEDVLSGSADVADAPRYRAAAPVARPGGAGRARGDAATARSSRSCSSAAGRGIRRLRPRSRTGRSTAGCRSAPPSAARTSSTTRVPPTPATSGSGSTRGWRSASATATC